MKSSAISNAQNYMESFFTPYLTPEVRQALLLKKEHTEKVAALCLELSKYNSYPKEDVELACLMGWCHDLGRFPQFLEYQTFDDRISIDHGHLSVKIILKNNLSSNLSRAQQKNLLGAVALHNRLHLPPDLPLELLKFSNLLRDADRLDIYRIFKTYYEEGPVDNSPLELGYPNTGQCSQNILDAINNGISPCYQTGNSVQDMRLIKLSWAYTFATPGARKYLLQSGIIAATQKVLPNTKTIAKTLGIIRHFCKQNS